MLLRDRVAWIRAMFDQAMEQFAQHEPLRKKVRALQADLDRGLAGVDLKTTGKRIGQVTSLIDTMMGKTELSGPVYEDLIHLKSMYSRYQNYAQWLKEQSGA